MYISKLILEGFRGFKNKQIIEFHEGINVIIGHNNSGKTTVIKALELLFGEKSNKQLSIDDFNKKVKIDELKEKPPYITISAKLKESNDEDEYSDDLVTVSTWLTKINKPYEALITYKFFLPDKELDDYIKAMNNIDSIDIQDYWYEIEYNFLRKYTYKVYVGNPEHQNVLESETIKKFDFQFLSAIRDVERDMFSGRNSLLKEVIDFFIDYEVKINTELTVETKKQEIKKRRREFSNDAKGLIEKLQNRMESGKKHMLKYAEETGASLDSLKPSFDGRILDTELYSALKLVVENETGIRLPASQNGLGYNNLIYISLLLAKMQKNASGEYLGSNAKVFSMLAIEEPEAHLHPNMQYKFLKFLSKNKENKVRQIFITTHSTNITAAVDLDNIIVLYKSNGEFKIAYPGKVFDDSDDDKASKNYIQRFLDVTKADIFFAKSVIFVEGISEQLLIPEFAKILNCNLIDSQVSIVNIGGRYFEHFLKLFDTTKSDYAIRKKVACLTDLDPVKKKKEDNSRWIKAFPFELNNDDDRYKYKDYSNNIIDLYPSENIEAFIKAYSQKKGESCTFEYDIVLSNPTLQALVTKSVSNGDEIKDMMSALESGENLDSLIGKIRNGDFKNLVEKELKSKDMDDNLKMAHLIAARYLKSIQKGVVAQELAYIISENYNKITSGEKGFDFIIPNYIEEAIKWICQE